MKALFLVGGSGTRLRPFTNYLPKPMIPIMGRPLLQRTCERLLDCGINEVVMNPCYMPEKITDYFEDGRSYGLNVYYEMEQAPLGTGGTIKNTGHHYDDSFFVFNADILHDISIKDMMAYHKRMGADVTIAATYVDDPTAYGTINYDEDGYIFEFKEKPKPEEVTSHYINAGIYIFEPEVLKHIPAGRPVSVEREVFPGLLEAGRPMAVYRDDGYWMDIGTPQKYVQTHRDIFSGICDVGETDFLREDVCIDETADIASSVTYDSHLFAGRNSHIGANCVLGQHVSVGDGAWIPANCYLDDVILWPGTRLNSGTVLEKCIVMNAGGKVMQFPYSRLGSETKGTLSTHEKRH